MRRLAGKVVDDFHILPAGVEDLQHVLVVGQQVQQRGHVEAVCQRIDGGCLVLIADLDQAQQRVVGVLAHEFGVDAHEIVLGQPIAKCGQLFGFGNQGMDLHSSSFLSGRFTALRHRGNPVTKVMSP